VAFARARPQISDGNLKNVCDCHEPTSADAVRAVLVFLNLREGDAEGFPQRPIGLID
jgi:hypothetical protein